MKKSFKDFLLWIHQLPQNLIGLAVSKFLKSEVFYSYIKGSFRPIHKVDLNIGVCLGDYIIIGKNIQGDTVKLHEWGHHLQSLKLGWLYLLVIGIPSFIGACVYKFKKFDYYKQPWEKWADELGGVSR